MLLLMIHFNVRKHAHEIASKWQVQEAGIRKKNRLASSDFARSYWHFGLMLLVVGMLGTTQLQAQDCNAEISVPLDQIGTSIFGAGAQLPQSPSCTCATSDEPACVLVKITSVPSNVDEMGCTLVIDPKEETAVGFTYNAMDTSCGMIDQANDELRIPISTTTGLFEFFLCKPGSGIGATGIEIDDVYLENCCETPEPTVSGDSEVCAGKEVRYEVDATTAAILGVTYNWTISSNGTVVDGGGANDDYVEIVWSGNGTVTVEATNPLYGGCSGADTQSVTVNTVPGVEAGTYVSQLTISAPITLLGFPNGAGGSWTGDGVTDNGNGSATFDPSDAGAGIITVTYTFTTADGCSGSDTATILVTDINDIEPDYIYCSDDPDEDVWFTDTGGDDRRYNDEPTVTIICPNSPGEVVKVDFQSFDVAWDDMLKVFDGDSPSAPQIDPGSGMGQGVDAAPNQGIVTASCTNMSGCLTFVFCVDDVGFGEGWEALVTCETRPDTEFNCEDLSNMYKAAECGEETVTLDIPVPFHEICGITRDVRVTASCSDNIIGLPADGTVLGDGDSELSLTFPLGVHSLTFSSTMIDGDDFECTIQVRVTASHLACKPSPVITTWDECYAYITPEEILDGDCLYDNDYITYEIDVEGVDIMEYTDEGYPLVDITNVDCGSTYKVVITRSYALDWNCNGDPDDDQPLVDECETFIKIVDYVTPIIENGPAVVEIPCYDDPGEQAVFAIGDSGGQVAGSLSGGLYLIPGVDDIEVIDNCEYDLTIGDWEYEAADCTTAPLDTDAPVFHYYQRKIVVVDQCGNRHSFKQRIAIVQPPIYPPLEVITADCSDDIDLIDYVNAWYEWVAEGRPADDPRQDYAVYVPNFDPTPNDDGTTDASGDEIPVAPNDAQNDYPNCGYNVTFEDTEGDAGCAGSREVWRNWEVFNWCQNGNEEMAHHHQLINIGDGFPPHFVGEPMYVFTPYDDSADCKGEITFWHPNVEDACGGNVFATIIYNGVEKSFVGGPVTFHDVMAGSTITVTFTATDECEDEATMDYDITIEGSGAPTIVCPGIQSVYLGDDCRGTLRAYGLGLQSSAPCGTLTYEIALESDDSDGDGYPEDEDYGDEIVFTDADLVNCQQTGHTVILRFTDQDGNHYYCDVEVWVKTDGDIPPVTCEDIDPYIIYSWDAMAGDLALVGESSDPVTGFQRLIDSGDLGNNVWESNGCLGNTWIDIIDVDYTDYNGNCPGGRICYKFKIRNECGYVSDVCTNCIIIDGHEDWTMNFPPDHTVTDGMIPNPATLDDIVQDNNGSWELEVVVETAHVGECSRKLIYNYYLKNTCTWDDRDDCPGRVDRPDGMIDGVVLRYRNNGDDAGNSIDDGNEALDNDGFDVTDRDDDADFVSLRSGCNPRRATVYDEISNLTGSSARCVSAHQYGYIHYQQMVIVDNGDSSIPIIQVLNLGPFCDTDLAQDDDGYCLVPVDISACIEFGCDPGALSDFSALLKPFGEGNGIADPYGTLILIDEKTCAIRGDYPLDPNLDETRHILVVTDGNYQFEIPFVVEDCTPATISLDDIGPFCGGDVTNSYGGCSAEVDIRASFDFGCGYRDIRDYEIKLKPFGEGPAISDPYGEVLYIDDNHIAVQGAYPLDPHNHITEHTLVICGDDNVVELPFQVKDCTPPTMGDCYNYIVEGEKLVHLTARQLDNGSHDLCTDYNDLRFFFADPLEHPDSTECTFTCEDGENGIIPYTLWAVDEWGNSSSCTGNIIIQDYDCDEEEDGHAGAAAIGGNIATEAGDMVASVEVNLRGGMDMDMTTTEDGHFMFEELPMEESYSTRPQRNDKAINGVTTYDMVFMSRHILGTRLLDSPYKMIAADVNNSGSITTFDLVVLRKLILGETEDFRNTTSWRFIPKDYVFPDPTNPWAEAFPEQIEIDPLASDMMESDFVAVKVGDVNGSANASNFQTTESRNADGQVFFQVKNQSLKAGGTYAVPFYLEAGMDIAGYQFSLQFDSKALDLVRVEAGTVAIEHFGLKYISEGVLTTSWNGTLEDASEPLFYLHFRSHANTDLVNSLTINSSRLEAEAYTITDNLLDVQLDFGDKLNSSLNVYQNRPNPFSDYTVLSFYLPEASAVQLEVLNTSGQSIKTFQYQLSKGKHDINVDLGGLPQEGVFYYQLSSNKEVATGKMVRIQE